MSLVVRNLAFSVLVPGAGGIYVPWLILTRRDTALRPAAWQCGRGHRRRRRPVPLVCMGRRMDPVGQIDPFLAGLPEQDGRCATQAA